MFFQNTQALQHYQIDKHTFYYRVNPNPIKRTDMKKYFLSSLLPAILLAMVACEDAPQPTRKDPQWIEKIQTPKELRSAATSVWNDISSMSTIAYALADSMEKAKKGLSPVEERALILQGIEKADPKAFELWGLFSSSVSLKDDSMQNIVESTFPAFDPLQQFNAKYFGPDSLMDKWRTQKGLTMDSLYKLLTAEKRMELTRMEKVALRLFEEEKRRQGL